MYLSVLKYSAQQVSHVVYVCAHIIQPHIIELYSLRRYLCVISSSYVELLSEAVEKFGFCKTYALSLHFSPISDQFCIILHDASDIMIVLCSDG